MDSRWTGAGRLLWKDQKLPSGRDGLVHKALAVKIPSSRALPKCGPPYVSRIIMGTSLKLWKPTPLGIPIFPQKQFLESRFRFDVVRSLHFAATILRSDTTYTYFLWTCVHIHIVV